MFHKNKDGNILLPIEFIEVFPLIVIDCDDNIAFVNETFSTISQYELDELIGRKSSFVCMNDPQIPFANSNQSNVIIQFKKKHQSSFWGTVTFFPVEMTEEGKTYTLAIITKVHGAITDNVPQEHSLEYLKTLEMAVNESNAVVVTGIDGEIISVNKRYLELSQYEEHELVGKTPAVVGSGHQPVHFYKEMWDTIINGEIWTGILQNKAKDGSLYWVNSTIVPVKNEHGKPRKFIAIQTEITERLELEKSLQRALKNDFENTVRNLHNIIFKYEKQNDDIVITLIAGKMLDTLSIDPKKVTMDQVKQYYGEQKFSEIKSNLENTLNGKPTQFELQYEQLTFLLYLSPIYQDDAVVEVVGTIIDITNRKNAENLVRRMAYYDFLTNLPNRRFLQENVEEILRHHKEENETCALIFIDIDRFKTINDSMGHTAGDELLVQFARRLESLVDKNQIVTRLGGDEFIIVLPYVDETKAKLVVEKIVRGLREPFNCRNIELYVTPSIGISMFPRDGIDYDTLLGSADIAMYKNKKERNKNYQFFTKELKQNILERTLIEMDLRQAIDKEQFHLVYQPIYQLETKQIVGVEALIRWNHPVKGVISPGIFIPLAEETGMIVKLGRWVIKEACRQIKSWHDAGLPPVSMAVNISIAQFSHPLFIDYVKEALNESQLDPSYLHLEVTESMMLDKEESLKTFKQLEEIGTPISVDDFGTGYSSLSYISNFPITNLKVDQSFIHNFTKTNQAIVKTIVNLAKSLELKVIAEGVEKSSQEAFLQELCCDQVQGYLYAKPLQASEIEQKLSKQIYLF